MAQKINRKQGPLDYIQLGIPSTQTLTTSASFVNFTVTSLEAGTKLSKDGNRVLIGAGVSVVRVGYKLMTENSNSSYMFSRIRRNSTEVSAEIDSAGTNEFKQTGTSMLVAVSEGDLIGVVADVGSSTSSLQTNRRQFLLVEVVE